MTEKALLVSGGGVGSTVTVATGNGEGPSGFGLRSTWGVVSVLYILVNAIKRLAPIALQPFSMVSSGLLLRMREMRGLFYELSQIL